MTSDTKERDALRKRVWELIEKLDTTERRHAALVKACRELRKATVGWAPAGGCGKSWADVEACLAAEPAGEVTRDE